MGKNCSQLMARISGLLFALVFFAPKIADGATLEALSETADVFNPLSPSCSSYDLNSAAIISEKLNCASESPNLSAEFQSATELKKIQSRVFDNTENAVFAVLAKQHAREHQCGMKFIDGIEGDPALIESLAQQVGLLREATQRLAAAQDELAHDSKILVKLCPLTLEELKPVKSAADFPGERTNQLCREIITQRTARNLILQRFPYEQLQPVKSLLGQYATLPNGAQFDQLESKLTEKLKSAFGEGKLILEKEAMRLKEIADTTGGKGFTRADRYMLMSDPAVIQKMIDITNGNADFKNFVCRMNSRYHSGSDALEASTMIASFAATGIGGMVLRGTSMAAKIYGGVATAQRAGKLSAVAGRIITASIGGTTSGLSIITAIENSCRSNLKMLSKSEDDRCASAPKLQMFNHDDCALAVSLNSLGLGVGTAGVTAKFVGRYVKKLESGATLATNERKITGPLTHVLTYSEKERQEFLSLGGQKSLIPIGQPSVHVRGPMMNSAALLETDVQLAPSANPSIGLLIKSLQQRGIERLRVARVKNEFPDNSPNASFVQSSSQTIDIPETALKSDKELLTFLREQVRSRPYERPIQRRLSDINNLPDDERALVENVVGFTDTERAQIRNLGKQSGLAQKGKPQETVSFQDGVASASITTDLELTPAASEKLTAAVKSLKKLGIRRLAVEDKNLQNIVDPPGIAKRGTSVTGVSPDRILFIPRSALSSDRDLTTYLEQTLDSMSNKLPAPGVSQSVESILSPADQALARKISEKHGTTFDDDVKLDGAMGTAQDNQISIKISSIEREPDLGRELVLHETKHTSTNRKIDPLQPASVGRSMYFQSPFDGRSVGPGIYAHHHRSDEAEAFVTGLTETLRRYTNDSIDWTNAKKRLLAAQGIIRTQIHSIETMLEKFDSLTFVPSKNRDYNVEIFFPSPSYRGGAFSVEMVIASEIADKQAFVRKVLEERLSTLQSLANKTESFDKRFDKLYWDKKYKRMDPAFPGSN